MPAGADKEAKRANPVGILGERNSNLGPMSERGVRFCAGSYLQCRRIHPSIYMEIRKSDL